MQDLLEKQGGLRDKTIASSQQEYQRMLEELGLLIPEQEALKMKTEAIGEALQQQADAAAQGENPEQGEMLANAFTEILLAEGYMEDALLELDNVHQETGGMSHEIDPALADQQAAMEAIVAAIQALQPPQQGDDQGQEEQEEQMSKQQAERRLQAAREREAERAERQQNQSASEPVEKDW
jgi:hypothetical protein